MEDIAGIDGLDVARTILGEGYRMPTQSEIWELENGCDWYWLTYKGVNGYFVQSKSNSNGIFLPAAGLRSGEGLYSGSGQYWSSTPYSGTSIYVGMLNFGSDGVRQCYDCGNRYYGYSIRAVGDYTINDIADAFKTKYATVLALEEEGLTADDRGSVKKALSKYSELSSEVQALLIEEKAKLEALMAAMPSGVPSSVSFVQLYENGPKWANMNIGAESVTDAGWYFWWGDVEGHANGEAFKFSSSNAAITSYNNNDGYVADGKLMADKDAATQNWGNGYRMPTKAEFVDLYNNCDWSWQTNYNGVEGVNGYLVTGKGDYSGNSIFLPAAGYRNGEDLYDKGSDGYCWSSTPISGDAYGAYNLYFRSDNVFPDDGYYRDNGFPVRPVSEL